MAEITISIGNTPIKIITDYENGFLNKITERYSNFIIEAPEDSQIVLKLSPNNKDMQYPDEILEHPSVHFGNLNQTFTVNWRDLHSYFDMEKMEGNLECSDIINLNNFLRILFSILLLKDSGFLVHAASLIRNNKGYIFPGKSGAGKTTITRLTPDSILLSDEVSLVKKVNGQFQIFGTPFWGELAIGGENTSCAVNSIYFPVKDQENCLNELNVLPSLQKLLPNVLFFSDEKEYRENLFRICNEFVESIPTAEIHFLPNPTFWRIIDDE